jgi:hypothetical protein
MHGSADSAADDLTATNRKFCVQNPLRRTFRAMKPKYLSPFYWLNRFIQLNREISAAIPPITEDDIKSLRKFSEHLSRRADKIDKSDNNESNQQLLK